MRKNMVILLVVTLLLGTFMVMPASASVTEFYEGFDGETYQFSAAGSGGSIGIMDGGVTGKALYLTGTNGTDKVLAKSVEIAYAAPLVFEVNVRYKITAHEGGTGFRAYVDDYGSGVFTPTESSDYDATVSGSEFKTLSFVTTYKWNATRGMYIYLEYCGTGTVLVDDVWVRNAQDGLIPNGDFEAETISAASYQKYNKSTGTAPIDELGGIKTDANGNSFAFVTGGWSDFLYVPCGKEVKAGEKYILSFKYKTTVQRGYPVVHPLFDYATTADLKWNFDSKLASTVFDGVFSNAGDGKLMTFCGENNNAYADKWYSYYGLIVIPEDGILTTFALGTWNHTTEGAMACYDDIYFGKADAPGMDYVSSNGQLISSIESVGEANLRTRCYYPKVSAAASDAVTLVQAIYEVDAEAVRKLVSIKVQNYTVSAAQTLLTVEDAVPVASAGTTLEAESFVWRNGELKPITNSISIK